MSNFNFKKITSFIELYKKAIGAFILFITLFLPVAEIVTSSSGFFGYGAGTSKNSIYLNTVLNLFGAGNNSNGFKIPDLSSNNGFGWIMFTIQLYILTIILGFVFLFINKKKYSVIIGLAYFVTLIASIILFYSSTSELNNSTSTFFTAKTYPSWGYIGLFLFGLMGLFTIKSDIKNIHLADSIDNIEDKVTHDLPQFAKDKFEASSDKVTSYFQFLEKSFKSKNYEKLITYLGFPLILIIALLSIESLRIVTFWSLVAGLAYFGFRYIVAQEVNKAQSKDKPLPKKTKKDE